MRDEIVNVIDKRLHIVLRDFEETVSAKIRAEWKVFSPDPNCPNNGQVMKNIKDICHKAYVERGNLAENTIKELLLQCSSELTHLCSRK
jgi:hypothetical protein